MTDTVLPPAAEARLPADVERPRMPLPVAEARRGQASMQVEDTRHASESPPDAETLQPSSGTKGGYPLTRIAVKSVQRIVIVQVSSIVRIEAEDNYVRLWADRPYLHKETLSGLVARLDPREFLRIHRSHAVNVRHVRELRPLLHGEYRVVLADGCELCSGRSYRGAIQAMFGLA